MACIKSAARSALVAFAPDAPYMAAGTMAGAVDLSFSSSSNLEIFKLDFQSDAHDLPVAGACPSSDRFNRLSWGKAGSASEEYSLGLVAGGLGDGSINVWNPLKLISSDSSEDEDSAFVARLEKHTGPVRGLEFNVHSSNLLASGADEGELCIWDLANPPEPTLFPPLKSVGSGAQTEVSFVSWNPKFQHILASTSHNGMTVVWDLRQQKPAISFSDRRRCSVLQWNPDLSTQLILASDDDNSPSLRVWDVRKTISPSREFVGHTKGVIAMSWCPNDSSFLLTCAKDNRTICWDTITGEIVCELPASNNWNFDIHWYPKVPGVISASSFDAKIGIYNIEASSRLSAGMTEFGTPARLRAPKWSKCPTGVSFGFGGKLVSFQPSPSALNAPSSLSEVYVHTLVTEDSLVRRSTEFEAAMQCREKASLQALCDKKSQDSESEDDRETWGFLRVMFEEDGKARTKLVAHLGFSVPKEGSENVLDNLGNNLTTALSFDEKLAYRGLSVDGGGSSTFPIDNGEEFFNNPQPFGDNFECKDDDLVNGEIISRKPEKDVESSDPTFDDRVQLALVVGDYKGAVLQCISANRMADALVIAHAGGPLLWESTRDQYLKKSDLPYLKVVSAMVNNDLMGLVNTRPLSSWKETLALICTFAQGEEWTALCDTLASRLMYVGNMVAATLCYICAGNIDRTVEIWSRRLKCNHEGRTYVDLLQDLMEKTIILAFATGKKRFTTSLSRLVQNYAELLASQGLLTTAMEYLKLLDSEDSSHELTILTNRIALSADERESKNIPENGLQQGGSVYAVDQSSFGSVDASQQHYQDNFQSQQRPTIPGSTYTEGYQQNFVSSSGGYQPVQQQFQGYVQPVPYQPTQPPQMFIPSQAPQAPQPSFAPPMVTAQPAVRPFVPSTPPTLRNVEQYQQPTLGSQLYPGIANPPYQSGPPGSRSLGSGAPPIGPVPVHNFGQVMAPTPAPRGFVPVTNPGFVQRPSVSPAQPSSPTQTMQAMTAAPTPPLTVQTVDTSNASAELRPVIATLTRLFNETSDALGGPRANPAKKREIEDNSRKIGSLFVKLSSGDISPNAASRLVQLCQALDSGDFSGALHIQVLLTTSYWEECNFWLAALKRMIKTRQNVRLH